ncbi:WD40 repeat-like protein [Lyophyllum atratum]|nr:WD40 repeat-like protein [Lyophyllum atratum]
MLSYLKHSSAASNFALAHGRNLREETMKTVLANGFPYSSKLSTHTSCVNALAFSSGDGQFLASGGDDFQISIWDFHQEDATTPVASLSGPRGNVFTLAFSAKNRYLYSGGTDETVLKYDISTFDSRFDRHTTKDPTQVFGVHDDSVREITCHPYQEDIFISAGQDGRILLRDGRINGRSTRAQDILQLTSEATGVQYHPIMEHIFVTSDSHGHVCLRDTRMAFGPLSSRTCEGIVQTYNTKVNRKASPHLSNPEASSVTFDREGAKLAVTMLHYLPTIYGLSDPNPIAVCSGRNHPDGTPISPPERTYSNSCTIKHGAFGGPGLETDGFYAAGSEDFRAYVWKIPSLAELADQRIEVSADDWASQEWANTVAFTEGLEEPRYIPVDLSTPFCRLTGHRSIVNSALFHPNLPHILTCGIEKDIILHSPIPASPCVPNLERTSTEIRNMSDDDDARSVYFRTLAGFDPGVDGDAEMATIMMFDHILREEGETDVFSLRKWSGDSDSSDEELNGDSDDDIEDILV